MLIYALVNSAFSSFARLKLTLVIQLYAVRCQQCADNQKEKQVFLVSLFFVCVSWVVRYNFGGLTPLISGGSESSITIRHSAGVVATVGTLRLSRGRSQTRLNYAEAEQGRPKVNLPLFLRDCHVGHSPPRNDGEAKRPTLTLPLESMLRQLTPETTHSLSPRLPFCQLWCGGTLFVVECATENEQ